MRIDLFKNLLIHDSGQLYSLQLSNGMGYVCQKTTAGKYIFFDDSMLQKHINGNVTVSIQPIQYESNLVKFIVFDIDDFTDKVHEVVNKLETISISSYVEFSGRKGFHVFVFLDKPIPAKAARDFAYGFLAHNKMSGIEVFPAGNFVSDRYYPVPLKLPLGIHRGSGKRSCFLDPFNLTPVNDIDAYLSSIVKNDIGTILELGYSFSKESYKKTTNDQEIDWSAFSNKMPLCIEYLLNKGVPPSMKYNDANMTLARYLIIRGINLQVAINYGHLMAVNTSNHPTSKKTIKAKEFNFVSAYVSMSKKSSIKWSCGYILANLDLRKLCCFRCPVNRKRLIKVKGCNNA